MINRPSGLWVPATELLGCSGIAALQEEVSTPKAPVLTLLGLSDPQMGQPTQLSAHCVSHSAAERDLRPSTASRGADRALVEVDAQRRVRRRADRGRRSERAGSG